MTHPLMSRALDNRWSTALKRGAKRSVQRVVFSGSGGVEKCVFVAGVQRSGTNMLMGILERSLSTDVYHESDPRAFDDYRMRDQEVIAGLLNRSPAPVFVIKALCELQDIRRLMQRFSPARTLWIYRDFHDVANSMIAAFPNVPSQVRQTAKSRERAGWPGEGLDDSTFKWLQEMVARDPDPHTYAALLWYIRSTLFFQQHLDNDHRLLLIRYEDLVTKPTEVFADVARFVDIPFTRRLLSRVHSRSIRRRDWPMLDPAVEAACGELLAQFDRLPRAAAGQEI